MECAEGFSSHSAVCVTATETGEMRQFRQEDVSWRKRAGMVGLGTDPRRIRGPPPRALRGARGVVLVLRRLLLLLISVVLVLVVRRVRVCLGLPRAGFLLPRRPVFFFPPGFGASSSIGSRSPPPSAAASCSSLRRLLGSFRLSPKLRGDGGRRAHRA